MSGLKKMLRTRARPCPSVNLSLGLTKKHFQDTPKLTGLVYDPIMLEHACLWDPNNPESADRLKSCMDRCQELGLVDRCESVPSRPSVEDELSMVHDSEYVQLVKSSSSKSQDQLQSLSSQYDGVYFHQKTFECSSVAAGSSIELVDQILQQKIQNGMALLRPPGHHAGRGGANGYCIFNNAAIAARHALKEGLRRIVILDWDVHHGQASQREFFSDPRVLYFSIHRYEHGLFWPNLRESNYDAVGQGKGVGHNVNVPLNQTGVTDSDYLAIFHQLVLPILQEFSPELVIVSAGYDAAVGCPEGCSNLSPAVFAHFTSMLMSFAFGKVAVLLEGGYFLPSLSESAALTLRALLRDSCPRLSLAQPPSDSVRASILRVIQTQRQYWSSLCYQDISEEDDELLLNHRPPSNVQFSDESESVHPTVADYPELPEDEAAKFVERVAELVAECQSPSTKNRTCYVYDESMKLHRNTQSFDHPEKPARIERIRQMLVDFGLADEMKFLSSREAMDDDLRLVHSDEHIALMRKFSKLRPDELHAWEDRFSSVYLSPEVDLCARMAAGCVLNVVDEVCSHRSRNGIAIVRPPGHHADMNNPCGFCFFNTVAIAAKYAQRNHNIKRVLILDWDVHHGNGTQVLFWDDRSVLYVSLHRYSHGTFFPRGPAGDYDKVGGPGAAGFNVNIPWNKGSMGDAEYLAAFHQVVLPIAAQFDPDLVLVSAGFDAARGDPLGGMRVSPEGFAIMTQLLLTLANGKVILALEGGYNLNSISECMARCAAVLLGHPCPSLSHLVPNASAIQSIRQVIRLQSQYWLNLCFEVPLMAPPMPSPKSKSSSPSDVTDSLSCQLSSLNVSCEVEDLEDSAAAAHWPPPQLVSSPDEKPVAFAAKPASESGKEEEMCLAEHYTKASKEKKNTLLPPDEESLEGSGGGAAAGAVAGAVGGLKDTVADMVQQIFGENAAGIDSLYAITPLSWCPHLEEHVAALPQSGLDVQDPCEVCEHVGENWTCLTCYRVFCSRFVNEHMLLHGIEANHLLVLSYADLSVWCYACEHYVHNAVLSEARKAAHFSKFGHEY